MMDEVAPSIHAFSISASVPCKLVRWCVQFGDHVQKGRTLCTYVQQVDGERWEEREQNLRSSVVGIVAELLQKEGAVVQPGTTVGKIEENCEHSVVVYDLCALCGKNLRKPPNTHGGVDRHNHSATVSMIHGIPELRISRKEAEVLGNKDKQRLLECQKLALVVDLDQTLIHTSMDPNIESGLPDVHTFTLPGYPAHYHCRLRPYVHSFLKQVSQCYELHVFTMGTKSYAKCVTEILDPGKRLFCDRIISRDECFDPTSKVLQLKSVFPCGDSMVAIIDDREDVWGGCPNLVHVKPYVFFAGTADINAPLSTQSASSASRREEETRSPHLDAHRPLKRRFLSSGATVPVKREHPVGPVAVSVPMPHPPHATISALTSRSPPFAQSLSRMPEAEAECATSDIKHVSFNENNNNNNSNNDDDDDEDEGDEGGGEDDDEDDDEGDGGNDAGGNEDGADKGDSSSSSSSSSSESSDSEAGGVVVDDSSSSGIDDNLFEPGSNLPSTSGGQGDQQQQGTEVANTVKSGVESSLDPSQVSTTRECEKAEVPGGTEVVGGHSEAGEVSTMGAGSDDSGTERTATGGDRVCEQLQPTPGGDLLESHSKSQTSSPPTHLEQASSQGQAGFQAHLVPREIKDSDDFLHYLGDTLHRIHSTFYSEYHMTKKKGSEPTTIPDLKEIIPRLRQSVLKGARVLFTGVIPTNTPPKKSPEWCTAVAFGAIIHEELVPGLHSCDHRKAQRATTHIIVGRPGTSKLKEAMKMPGIKLVSPAWLWACAERWQWVDESQFPLQFEHHARDRGKKGRGPSKDGGSCGKSVKQVTEAVRGSDESSRKEMKSKEKETVEEGQEEVERAEDEEGVGRIQDEEEERADDCEGERDEEEPQSTPSRTRRHLARLDSYLSVSDEELEKMDAEVDAEIGDSSSNSEDVEGMGTIPAEDVEGMGTIATDDGKSMGTVPTEDVWDIGTVPTEDVWDIGTVPTDDLEVMGIVRTEGAQPQSEEDPLSGLLADDAEKGLDLPGELEEDEGLYGRKRKRVDVDSNSSASASKGEELEPSSVEEDDGSGIDDLALLLADDD